MTDLLPYISVLAITGLALLGLGFYVLHTNKSSSTSRAFFMMTLPVAAWCILAAASNTMIKGTADGVLSLRDPIPLVDEFTFIAVVLIGPAFLNLMLTNLGIVSSEKKKWINRITIAIAMVSAGVITYQALANTPILHTSFKIENGAYITERGRFFYNYLVPANYSLILAGIGLIIYRIFKPRHILERRHALIFFAAVIPALIGNIVQLTQLHNFPVDITPLSFGLTTIIFAVGVMKYGMFIVEPVREETIEEGEARVDLSLGMQFYVSDPEYGFEIFADIVKHDTYGMGFTTKELPHIRTTYGLEKTLLFQFNKELKRDMLDPNIQEHKELLPFMIKVFAKEEPDSILIVHGLDDFVELNAFTEMIKDINSWMRKEKKGRLLLAVNEENTDALNDILADCIPL
ncbi:MAG: hypothetical protein KAT70_03065 [Thermoplasmata archaeon]|nr:hypothetical protein [Thermoplasmata archaeon]